MAAITKDTTIGQALMENPDIAPVLLEAGTKRITNFKLKLLSCAVVFEKLYQSRLSFLEASMRSKMKRKIVKPQRADPP